MRERSAPSLAAPAALAVVCLVCASTVRAQAQTPTLDVTRGADVQDCPDASRLGDDVAAVRGPTALPTTTAYSVDFARNGRTFSASIRSGPTGANVRRLETSGQTCAALAHAVALTLALLIDSDKAPNTDLPEPAPIPEPPRPVASRVVEAPAAVDHHRRNEATATFGGMALLAVLRPLTPALTGELGLETGRWRTGLGVLAVLPQSIDLGPGTVRESVLGGSARVCYAPWPGDVWRFDVCTGAFVGVVKAEGRGYTQNDTQTQPWLAVPLELAVAAFTGPLGLELAAGGIASIDRPDFSVGRLGIAVRPPPVGATLSLRAIARIPW
jgi:hypothetical protein